jgi:hypothetical protein
MTPPIVKHCPFCGSNQVKLRQGVPRCYACGMVFIVSYSRKFRMGKKKREAKQ